MIKQNTNQRKQIQKSYRTMAMCATILALVFSFPLLRFCNSISYAKAVNTTTSENKIHTEDIVQTANNDQAVQSSVKHIWIVTNEIKVPAKQGKPEMEVYRWDPGTIVLHQGDHVMLHIYGVKGKSHPFELEGYPVKGVVIQRQVTKILFTADKVGTFRLVCLSHIDTAHNGPMIAYVEVLPTP